MSATFNLIPERGAEAWTIVRDAVMMRYGPLFPNRYDMNTTPTVRDLVYDVGIHKGEDTSYYLAKGYRVVAFEADPALAELCRSRFRAEHASGQFDLIEGAIDDGGSETVRFYRHPTISVFGTTDAEWMRRNSRLGESTAIEVPSIDFAACIRSTGMPHFMKVDIEGADRLCFEALRRFVARPQFVSMESSKVSMADLIEEFELLESLGYDRFAVVQQATLNGRVLETSRLTGDPLRYRLDADSSGPFGEDVGPWLARPEAIAAYRRVFRRYRVFGDASPIRRTRVGRRLLGELSKVLGVPLPGWFDTHAQVAADYSCDGDSP
ncbi:MAG: FkbM family methyltransferase [Solirubrobacteraceae bacterium]|nr:FkbM family methyltransferase [Solirubrobacteraceae bacterium]